MYSDVLYLSIREGSLFVELFVNCQIDIFHPPPPPPHSWYHGGCIEVIFVMFRTMMQEL
jgi:hypothetical protein